MPVKFKIERLQPYRFRIDPDVRMRYRLLSQDALNAWRETDIKADDDSEAAEDAARDKFRDLFAHVAELWHGQTVYKDADDIADTILAAPAFRDEASMALIRSAVVEDEEAPF